MTEMCHCTFFSKLAEEHLNTTSGVRSVYATIIMRNNVRSSLLHVLCTWPVDRELTVAYAFVPLVFLSTRTANAQEHQAQPTRAGIPKGVAWVTYA